jgi:hypothetical protein
MVTALPTVPVVGVSEEMVGGFTVNVFPGDVPTVVVTVTDPVVALLGTTHLMAVFDQEV